MSEEDDQYMSPDEAKAQLEGIGALIRLSELPDEIVVAHVTTDILLGLYRNGFEVTNDQLGEILALALVTMGGFHRVGSC